ncbi:MAG: T9SS type A sorting domain-containing protein, partial [Bacteroidia bacterium]
VSFTHVSTSSAQYAYVITDDQNTILGLPPGNMQDFEGAGTGDRKGGGLGKSGDLGGRRVNKKETASLSSDCFDLSSNFIEIVRSNTNGGTVAMPSGATRRYTCPGDGNADVVSFTHVSTSSAQYAYVITDDQNTILGLPPGNMQDFEGAGTGTCRVWGLSYTGSLTAMMGQNAATASLSSDCFDLSSNFIEVVRSAPDGGMVTSSAGNSMERICVNGSPDPISFVNNSSSNALYQYIITDDNGIILAVPPVTTINFDGAGPGTCRVYGASYTGTLTAVAGQNINTVTSSDCFDLSSNYLAVERDNDCQEEICSADDFQPGNSTAFAVLLNGITGAPANTYSFDNNSGSLVTYDDGTANLTGTIVMQGYSNYKWDVNVWFVNKRNWTDWSASGRTYKGSRPVAVNNHTNWDYYELDMAHAYLTGTVGSAFAGDTISLSPQQNNNYGFQKGLGANDKNGNFGASTWFDFAGTYSGFGDFNLALTCAMAPRMPVPVLQFRTAPGQPISQDLRTYFVNPSNTPLAFGVAPTSTLTGMSGAPQHGVLNLQTTGQFVYTPQLGYTGTDAFRFRAHDTGAPAAFVEGTVDINVGSSSLPVTWVSFSAKKVNDIAVELDWVTSGESNNAHFIVEKSVDLESFSALSQVEAQNETGLQSYQHVDRSTMEQRNYYRLKQVDQDGSFSYSSVIEVAFGETLADNIILFPNPAQNILNISLPIGTMELELHDMAGRILERKTTEVEFASEHLQWNVQDLSKGVYMITISDEQGNTTVKRFVKQ